MYPRGGTALVFLCFKMKLIYIIEHTYFEQKSKFNPVSYSFIITMSDLLI